MMYQLYKAGYGITEPNAAMTVGVEPQVSFLFDLANTDYQQFLKDIKEGVELVDADGNAVTDFVSTLP